MALGHARGFLRFGTFELDVRSGELQKTGVRVGLQEQSLQVLALLVERAGDLVSFPKQLAGSDRAAHEVGRQRGMAHIRSGRRAE